MVAKSRSCVGRTGEALTEYYSEVEAQRAASRVSLLHGTQMLAYRCGGCQLWHLAPEDRHTPSVKCSFCLDGRGGAKELYPSREIAEKRAKISRREKGADLKVYLCPFLDGWHLTTR